MLLIMLPLDTPTQPIATTTQPIATTQTVAAPAAAVSKGMLHCIIILIYIIV